jgi:hypothetical protein
MGAEEAARRDAPLLVLFAANYPRNDPSSPAQGLSNETQGPSKLPGK